MLPESPFYWQFHQILDVNLSGHEAGGRMLSHSSIKRFFGCPSGPSFAMQNSHSVLLYLRPAKLIYVRETGPYERTIPRAWDRLLNWLDDRGLYKTLGRGYGLARDNPKDVGFNSCRYDACIEVTSELEDRAICEVGLATLPGGAYACRRLTGDYDQIRSVVSTVYSEFEPVPGLRMDESRPVVTIYVDNPNTYKESDLRADICMPVTALDDVLVPNTAVAA
jgi:AraC family transcriptional regulator